MKISLNLNNNFNRINFKSSDRMVKINPYGEIVSSDSKNYCFSDGELLYSNYTSFFRHDLNRCNVLKAKKPNSWNEFMKIIEKEFKKAPKVNVYDVACSDGSEIYSFMMKLIDDLGIKKSQKYFPIQAYDIDEKILKTAQSGLIPCDYDDLDRIDKNLSKKSSEFYKVGLNHQSSKFPVLINVDDSIKENVCFNQKDFSSMIDEINPSNSLIFCRNFLPYLSEQERNESLKKLVDKIDDTSVIVLGDFDSLRLGVTLHNLGLTEIDRLVYKKNSN